MMADVLFLLLWRLKREQAGNVKSESLRDALFGLAERASENPNRADRLFLSHQQSCSLATRTAYLLL